MPTHHPPDVLAAGAVVLRPGRLVLLVHRPKYDDWSFPKGKLEPGEHAVAAAVREVAEETGLHVRLGVPLAAQRYPLAGGQTKSVDYWVARAVGDDDVSGYRPNAEIDAVAWVPAEEAAARLTYDYDRATLDEALDVRRRTRAIVVLRHGQARSRRSWRGEDQDRPLVKVGEAQAERLVPLLAAYDVTRIVTSTSWRCRQTVGPFAEVTGWPVEGERALTEEHASTARVAAVVTGVLEESRGVLLCTHRPVLPEVFAALGLRDPGLDPGELLVAHVRKGRVRGIERHLPR